MGAAVPEVDGKPLFQPSRTGTLMVAGALALSALAVALHGHLSRFWLAETVRWGLLALGAVMLLRGIGEFRYVGLFKSVRDSRFARNDTRFYSPCACCWVRPCCSWPGRHAKRAARAARYPRFPSALAVL